MASDRRQYPRLVVHSPVLVSLGKSKVGLLFDLCEGGLSVHGFVPKSQSEFVSFDLPKGEYRIEARVEIAWTSDSENRTGLRFVQVGGRSQQKLREWIGVTTTATSVPSKTAASHASDFPISPISPENASLFSLHVSSESELRKSAVTADVRLSPHKKSRRGITIFVVAAFMCAVLVSLGYYYLPNLVAKLKFNRTNVESRTTQLPSNRAFVSPARQSNLPSSLPLDQSGFVLQVGAMRHEENVEAFLAIGFPRHPSSLILCSSILL